MDENAESLPVRFGWFMVKAILYLFVVIVMASAFAAWIRA